MKFASVLFRSSSSVDALQIATAIIEAGAGFALLGFPSRAVELLLGAPLVAPDALTVARVGGAGLLTLGAAFWLARGDTQSRAARGLVTAVVLYNVAVVFILGFVGIRSERVGLVLWPAVALHIAMTIWCVVSLRYASTVGTERKSPLEEIAR
jgi:ribosomal protein S18 acetylase RimI-like enzyme